MKVALVTGANTGIGLAIAERFLADGYAVGYATAGQDEKHEGPYQELVRRYGDDHVHWVWGDLSDAAVPAKLLEDTVRALGSVDVLVNNAGLSTAKPFLELTVDDFDLTFAVDVRASFLLAQAAARQMEKGGSIVNITSVHEEISQPGSVAYDAAKAALRSVTRTLALELASKGVRLNNVAPGLIATPLTAKKINDPERAAHDRKQIPMHRPGEPHEVANVVLFLASDAASYVTGSSYFVDGGLLRNIGGA